MQAKVNESFQKGLSAALVVLVILSAVTISMLASSNSEYPSAEEIASAIVIPAADLSKLDEVHNEIFEEDAVEEIALNLALDELDSRDFKEELAEFLEDEIVEVDGIDYTDIESFSIRDSDVDVEGEDAEVYVEFKVYVSNYGDEDEEERARLSVYFEIEDLDEDESYEDAEVSDWEDLELIRFYD